MNEPTVPLRPAYSNSVPINGIDMHYEIYGEAGNEPLLWLSGFGGIGADCKYLFKEVPEGFRIIAPDLRGHGASTGTDGPFSFRQAGRDLTALLDHLQVERIKAIGLSGGGIALLHLATQHPERVAAMVPISAPPYFPPQARQMQRLFSFAALGEAEMSRMRERHKGGDSQLEWIVAQTHAMADTHDDVDFSPALLGTITARTLIVFGDSDPLYPVKLAFELHEGIARSSLWIVPQGGHGPIFGPNAPRFLEIALPFLSRK